MGRGDKNAWNKSQIAKSNAGLAAAGGYGGAAGSELGSLSSGYQGIIANPMSPEERAGVLSAAGGAYDSLGEKASERTAKTRNAAGYGELLDELARGKSRSMGETASGLGTEEFRRKMEALRGVQGLYGTNVEAQTKLLEPGKPDTSPGFWQNFLFTLMGNANRAAQGMGKDT